MRLASLELQGFKSFPDKTYLEFDDGITAVVGPNGSGKSNIADAVRWVFGEQSTKTLRGGKMEDIIFGGTQMRKPVGYASVKLTIENISSNSKDDKTTISRKLYRSGESEYKINANIVRLRDIYELFMDTGLGRDGYSIIGQGKIADIVSAKSNQRREIFEEAAGIAKFRYRRNEAEKQLLGAQENLLRLNDILAELEARVGPLKIQSEKAKKYIVLAEERKELEISLWINELNELKKQIESQNNKVLIAKNDYNLLESEAEKMENALSQTYLDMQQMTVQIDEQRNFIKSLQEELSGNDSKIAVMKNDIFHNQQTAESLNEQIKSAGKNEQEFQRVILDRNLAKNSATEKLVNLRAKIEADKSSLIEELEQNNHHQRKLDELLAQKSSISQSLAEIRLKQASEDSVVSEGKKRLEDLYAKDLEYDKIVDEYKANLVECQLQIEQQQANIQSLENTKSGYNLKRDSRKQAYEELLGKRSQVVREIEQIASRKKMLEDMEANMEGYTGSVKYIINQHKKGSLKGIHGIFSSLISTESDYILAIETALGLAAQNVVVEDENTAKRCIQMLKEAKAGRATFLPLTSVKGNELNVREYENTAGFVGLASSLVDFDSRFSGIVYQLLGRVCVVDDINTGTMIAKKAGYKFRIVTLDGQVINAGGSYTGGTASKSIGSLGRKFEIEKLEDRIQLTQKNLDKILPEIEKYAEEMSNLDAVIVGTESEIKTANEELVRLGFMTEQQKRSLIDAEHNRNIAKEELERISARLLDLEQGTLTANQLIEENTNVLEQIESELARIYSIKEEITQKSEQKRRHLAEFQLEEVAFIKDIETISQEIERLDLQLSNAGESNKKLSETLSKTQAENQSIEREIEAIALKQKELNSSIQERNAEIEATITSRTALEKSTTELRQKERELGSKREEVSREMVRLEERQSSMQLQYDEIISKLWDEYELTRSVAVVIAKPIESKKDSEDMLSRLRSQIRALGSVNLDAVEEYKEVGERYEFMSHQLNDIHRSKEKLEGLIKELTAEMRLIFKDNFEKIQKEFSTTFTELFGGGRGELRLTDEEDVLESGIDILVQPPGKVIKNLSLLSGGEQAFVAIAIYFAILKVKPAPFVLLDEIEAALDDVNVTRFATYLRTLANDIQFITITHRRGTMEEADVLYGVTMQEDGISKMLELKVNEIESKLGMEA